jgi:hypothetical protein
MMVILGLSIFVDERERPFYVTEDERIVEIQGETEKVLKALQAVSNHLRRFLVDHSVLPLFEKTVSVHLTPSKLRQSTLQIIFKAIFFPYIFSEYYDGEPRSQQ